MTRAIVFPGQGSQSVGMGKELNDNFAAAKEVFQKVDDILSQNLSKIIFEGPSEELTQTQNTQPALMAVSIALIEVIKKDFGKDFSDLCAFTAGHSLGEYSALCAAGAISLEETARLLKVRGSQMAKCGEKTQGAMAAILNLEPAIVEEIVNEAAQGDICQIANDNSVGQIVISGSKEAIDRAIIIAKEKGAKRALPLPVSGAFHSNLMQDAKDAMIEALNEAQINQPQVPVIANVTANLVQDPEDIKKLLAEQITGSVRWRESMLFLESKGVTEVVEIGAGKVLSGLVGRTCKEVSSRSIQTAADIEEFLK